MRARIIGRCVRTVYKARGRLHSPHVKRISPVPSAEELLDRAFRRAKKARGKGRNALDRRKSRSVAAVNAFVQALRQALRRVQDEFPSLESLPPFYAELVDVLAGADVLRRHLGSLRWADGKIREVARDARRAIRRASDLQGVERGRKACYGRVSSVIDELAGSLEALEDTRLRLKPLPTVDPTLPTIVIAGAPNVGKSQLVQALSSGRPRIASYPFTTLDLSLGHFEAGRVRYQVMDTPGLLDRPLHERNEVERQALVSLRHVADLILFLLDPTGTCGYPLETQEALLVELRAAFPETPFLEVENKADVGPGTGSRRRVSALTGEGIPALLEEAVAALTAPAPAGGPPWEAA